MSVDLGGAYAGMAQGLLNKPQVFSSAVEIGGKCVAKTIKSTYNGKKSPSVNSTL